MLSLSIKLNVWLALVSFAVVFVAGLVAAWGQVQTSALILLATVAVGFFNAWRNK